jgi:Ras-related protein Rab-21
VKELRKMAPNNIVLAIAGNKSDMDKMQHVNVGDTERYAESIGATHFVTSAKLNAGINEVFLDVAHRVLEQRKSHGPETVTVNPRRKSVVIVDKQSPDPSPPSKCCS